MLILAAYPPVLAIVVGVAVLIGLGVGALFLFRGYEHLALRSLERRYAGLSIHADPQPGDVIVSYHTYHGFIAWFSQIHHHVALPPEDARKLLGRLLRFNLVWGLVTYGALFIPPLAILNYFSQRRSIREQEALGGIPQTAIEPAENVCEHVVSTAVLKGNDLGESRSPFHRIVGLIAACLSVMFAICTLVCLATGEIAGVVGGVVVTLLLGSSARDYLRRRKSETA